MSPSWRPCVVPALFGFLCAGLLSLFTNGPGLSGLSGHIVPIQRTSLAATHRVPSVDGKLVSTGGVDAIERSRQQAHAWRKPRDVETGSTGIADPIALNPPLEMKQPRPSSGSVKEVEPQPKPPPQPAASTAVVAQTAGAADADLPDYLRGTAFVSMAAGDVAGRQAIALFSSLRTVQTRIPRMLLLLPRGGTGSADCQNEAWKKARGRENIPCYSRDAIAPEIVSQQYLDTLQRMGVETRVIDPVPRSKWSSKVVGSADAGPQVFWSVAFNKLVVFNLTEFRKLLWMDSDTLVLKNIDHLLREPSFSATALPACCHSLGPAYTGGGLWVLEPSAELYADMLQFLERPVPGSITPESPEGEGYRWGDMQVRAGNQRSCCCA